MGKIQPIHKIEEVADEPPSLHGRAMDNLAFIRETMEKSAVFTSVPGYGGMLMGVTACFAAYIAHTRPTIREWLITWLLEACLAFAIGMLAMWQKSKLSKLPLISAPSKKFVMNSLPAMICGVVITLGLWRFGMFEIMIPIWLLLYGASVVTGGSFSVKAVPIMGWCFIAVGTIAFFVPNVYGNLLMAIGFGVLHIVFGFIIGRKFGG
jgi:hypothetical protein